jgi:hypothetical protein
MSRAQRFGGGTSGGAGTVTAANITDASAAGRALLQAADAAAQRTALRVASVTRQTANASAIPAGTTPFNPGVLGVAVTAGEWALEWILDLAYSVGTDVLLLDVAFTSGGGTGRMTVEGISGDPAAAGVPRHQQVAVGTATTVNANSPGAPGANGGVSTVRLRARVVVTTAGNIAFRARAVTTAGASSGTLTVQARSQVSATPI